MKVLYTANATSVAGRGGHGETDDGNLKVDLVRPGASGPGTNPEQLFAIGYAACFGGAVEAVARNGGTQIGVVTIKSQVTLNQDDEGGYFIAAVLDVNVADVDVNTARDLVQKAHQVCPYSKATRGNIDVTLKVDGEYL